jgi:hypothetical protein
MIGNMTAQTQATMVSIVPASIWPWLSQSGSGTAINQIAFQVISKKSSGSILSG